MTFARTMMMKSIIGHRNAPLIFAVASKKRPIISRRCFLSITNISREMMIDEISKDDDMRNDAAYSLSLASNDLGFSPLSRDLNEREMEQLSISKNQLLHALRQDDDPVSVSLSRKQENITNHSNYYRDDSTIISSIVSSSKPIQQLNIFTTTTHNSNLSKRHHSMI
jgi:methyl coenzyme M reductase gamma subunit